MRYGRYDAYAAAMLSTPAYDYAYFSLIRRAAATLMLLCQRAYDCQRQAKDAA